MSWGRVVVLNSEIGVEIHELKIIELFLVIKHEGPRDPKLSYYRTLDGVAYLLFCDCC